MDEPIKEPQNLFIFLKNKFKKKKPESSFSPKFVESDTYKSVTAMADAMVKMGVAAQDASKVLQDIDFSKYTPNQIREKYGLSRKE